MKTFLVFLGGALLGSAAVWFTVLGNQRPAPAVRESVPANVPVTQPAPRYTPPQASPAIRREPAGAPPPTRMTPAVEAQAEADKQLEASAQASRPSEVVQSPALPPESTPVAPIPAASITMLPPPAPANAAPTRALALTMPVVGIKPTQLLDTFTDARSEGRSHDAIDIMAPTGTPVVAVEDGTIAKLFDSKQGGHTIYQFDAPGELAYYYAHLDHYAPGLVEGQAVKRGDVIGYVGYTGNANPAGPHLHFAIFQLGPEKRWWKGTPINPYRYLGGR
jgi:murein DD-endopeptidase MepM/ murein hydrolase activator NlpD